MYDRILVTTDGSENSSNAVKDAKEIAKKFNSEIHILNVIDLQYSTAAGFLDTISGKAMEAGKEATEKIAKEIGEGFEIKKEVNRGIPSQEINRYAQDNDIDLIVMASEGRTGLEHALIGSTAEKVTRTSQIPVMTVRRD
jgi:nucleotide-binding universal stress UspA family protein